MRTKAAFLWISLCRALGGFVPCGNGPPIQPPRDATTCGWRIRSMSQPARAVQSCTRQWSWYSWHHARTASPRDSPADHRRETAPPRWRARRCGRVPGAEAPATHLQLLPTTCPESHYLRSLRARTEHAVREPAPYPETCCLVKPATLFKFHKALVEQKYRQLFSSSPQRRKPGPKGPSAELVAAIVELKSRNPQLAVCASPSRSLTPLASRSTRMSCRVLRISRPFLADVHRPH